MEPDTYIWRCDKNHESAITEAMMRQAKFEPRCQLAGCNAKLIKKVRPYPETEQVDRFSM